MCKLVKIISTKMNIQLKIEILLATTLIFTNSDCTKVRAQI